VAAADQSEGDELFSFKSASEVRVFSSSEARSCLRDRHILLIGNSVLYDVWEYMHTLLFDEPPVPRVHNLRTANCTHTLLTACAVRDGLRISYIYHRFIGDPAVRILLKELDPPVDFIVWMTGMHYVFESHSDVAKALALVDAELDTFKQLTGEFLKSRISKGGDDAPMKHLSLWTQSRVCEYNHDAKNADGELIYPGQNGTLKAIMSFLPQFNQRVGTAVLDNGGSLIDVLDFSMHDGAQYDCDGRRLGHGGIVDHVHWNMRMRKQVVHLLLNLYCEHAAKGVQYAQSFINDLPFPEQPPNF
jgi:hypothetical protein